MVVKSVRRASGVNAKGLPVFLLAAALLAAAPARAPAADQTDLKKVEDQIQADRKRAEALESKRRKASEDLHNLRREAIAAAKKAQQHEARLIDLEATLLELSQREDTIRESLTRRRSQMTGTLAALQRLSRNPPQTMLAYPDAPTDMVRSALLLRTALPGIKKQADALSRELNELSKIREDTRTQLASLEVETLALEKEQNRLRGVLKRKSTLLRQTESERKDVNRRMAELGKRAASIRDLLAQIEKERKRREAAERKRVEDEQRRLADAARAPTAKPDDEDTAVARAAAVARPAGIKPFPEKGQITIPVSGRIVTQYGARNKFGQTERGVTYATRPGAQIVAPHDGLVAFAGPFEGYGHILIIEHDGGYHTLLAGLERLDTSVGQWVLRGEPIGAMGNSTIDKGGDTVGLYLELRRKGQPIDPNRWIASGKQNRTSG
jgi:septal ring factor EnvC (AmiA/AmiB activator)